MPSQGLEQHGQLAMDAAFGLELGRGRAVLPRAACDDRAGAPTVSQEGRALNALMGQVLALERDVRGGTARVHAHDWPKPSRCSGPTRWPRQQVLKEPSLPILFVQHMRLHMHHERTCWHSSIEMRRSPADACRVQ